MSKQDAVLITGASGFIGSAVARAARKRGFKVRVLVRPSSPRRNLTALNAEVFEGDMRDEATVSRALAGARLLVAHLAADYRLWARNPRRDRTQ